MKTTLIVIEDEADHAVARKLIEKPMGSSDPKDRARMVAQARLSRALSHLGRFARSTRSTAQQNSCVSLPAKIYCYFPV